MPYWSDPEDMVADGRRLAVLATDEADVDAHRRARAEFVSQLEPAARRTGAVVPPAMPAHHADQLLVLPNDSSGHGHPGGRQGT